MDYEPYRWVLEEHKLSSRPPALSAIVLLAFAIGAGLAYGSTIPPGLRPWMINLLYPPLV
jgi:hypothetical protein